MREIRSKPEMPVWYKDGYGRTISLLITRAGLKAIGLGEADKTNRSISNKSSNAKRADRSPAGAGPRAGSKQALVIEMLSKDEGATLDALAEATGWLPHTTRAALTGLRKRGFAVERIRNGTKGSLYRITHGPKAAAGP
jgi:DNA-binding MarR family transcriptional regulator